MKRFKRKAEERIKNNLDHNGKKCTGYPTVFLPDDVVRNIRASVKKSQTDVDLIERKSNF